MVDDFYIHLSACDRVPEDLQNRITSGLSRLPHGVQRRVNVAKINLRSERFSLLSYPGFEDSPFPVLAASWSFQVGDDGPAAFRTYEHSPNPPILHRKELLVSPQHPRRAEWEEITRTAESLGLFDDAQSIGFLLNWERLLKQKSLQIVDAQFAPIGNDISGSSSINFADDDRVERHLTALSRAALSAPVQLLIRHGLLSKDTTLFDYGCGKGHDIAALSSEGFRAQGWDPHFAPGGPLERAAVVNLGFVINVIEDSVERIEALQSAFGLTESVMAVSVMLYGSLTSGTPFRDGFRTSRNTFQKYFSQAELRDYLEQVLHQEAFLVAPGIAYLFADKDVEQRFIASRYRSSGVARRLLTVQRRLPKPKVEHPTKLTRRQELLERSRPLLDQLWACALNLGRLPQPDEVPDLGAVEGTIGPLNKAMRILVEEFDGTLLAASAKARMDDLRLYFAMQQFSRRPPYRRLEVGLQRDIKALFGDYAAAQDAGMSLLVDAASAQRIQEACEVASCQGLGWLEGQHSLQLHVTLVDRLPVVLRAFVGCGLLIYGALGEVDVVKIHIRSGKLSLMEYERFDANPLPRLSKRVKVNVRRLDYDLFEYGSLAYPKPLLYRKSRLLHEDYPGYAQQLAFDESLEQTGLLDESEFGPTEEQLLDGLNRQRLEIESGRLQRSRRIPSLDEPCGQNFRYRDFIECGHTQKRLGLPNIPVRPETYNAIYDLASEIIDPLIEYFGPIRLTYGFSSPQLSKHIDSKIAPELDQHASCELGSRAKMVCARGGAACDLIIDDEDMREVAIWIREHLPFDRLYFYGNRRPIHVSAGPERAGAAFEMRETAGGRLTPRRW